MNKKTKQSKWLGLVAAIVWLICSAFVLHKFYMGIYQVAYSPAKKRVELTMRLFVDDCNTVLYKVYRQKTKLGDTEETAAEVQLLTTYIGAHFKVVLNQKSYPIHFKRKELENNVLVCYFTCDEVPKLTQMAIENTMFTDVFPDQQNMIQAQLFGKKQSALLTKSSSQAAFYPEEK